jgi:large conductance mechanosensitive channel
MKGFKEFLLKNQVLGLAVAVIMGGAIGKVVSSLVADILMPFISLLIPGGEWRAAKFVLSTSVGPDGKEVINALTYGTFVGSIVDFVVIAFCVYMIMKALIKEAPAPEPAPTKQCPRCTETIPLAAKKCRYCTTDLVAGQVN